MAVADIILPATGEAARSASRSVLDCWHVAGAAARLLSRATEYEVRTMWMMVATCRQVAMHCAWVCETASDDESVINCLRACEQAASACSELLNALWQQGSTPSDDELGGTPPEGVPVPGNGHDAEDLDA